VGSTPAKPVILLVDPDAAAQAELARRVGPEVEIQPALDPGTALDRLRTEPFGCVAVHPSLLVGSGLAFLQRVRDCAPQAAIVILPPGGGAEEAARALRLGVRAGDDATDREPPSEPANAPVRFEEILGRSASMRRAIDLARRMAENDSRVLITGETGTGKDLLARAIHSNGLRHSRPFVAVNCAAIPESLAEGEFFGHEKGAFTGADRRKRGRFEMAHRGTLFLDEITCLPAALQLKLLRVLQDGIVTRVGGEAPIRVDVRLIAATNRDIRAEVSEGRFREDLYYRLKVAALHVPPLRERREDIPLLLDHFLKIFGARFRRDLRGYTEGAVDLLTRYDWPGNVRELEHAVEYLAIMEHGTLITTQHLSTDILAAGSSRAGPAAESLKAVRDGFERQVVLEALIGSGWNQTRAAQTLGLSRTRLIAKMKKYSIRPPKAASR